MRSTRLFILATLGLACFVSMALAQSGRVYRIGFLITGEFTPGSPGSTFADGIIRVLAQKGYVVGRNLEVQRLGAAAHKDRLTGLAAEMVARNVDVIAINNYPAAAAAREATRTIPIVISGGGDPVKTNLIVSLAHPGGNITGVSDVAVQLAPKRLSYLIEAVPKMKRVAMLWNADDPGMTLRYEAAAEVAKRLGITVHQAEYAFNRGVKKIRRRCPFAVAYMLQLRDELGAARLEARKVRQ